VKSKSARANPNYGEYFSRGLEMGDHNADSEKHFEIKLQLEYVLAFIRYIRSGVPLPIDLPNSIRILSGYQVLSSSKNSATNYGKGTSSISFHCCKTHSKL